MIKPLYYLLEKGKFRQKNPQDFRLCQTKGVYTTLAVQYIRTKTKRAKALNLSEEPVIFRLHKHITRVLDSACRYGYYTNPQAKDLRRQIETEVINQVREIYSNLAITQAQERLRIRIAFNPQRLEIFFDQYQPSWPKVGGIKAIGLEDEREEPHCKGRNFSRLLNLRQKANQEGQDEVLLIDSAGVLREGIFSNIFWFDQNACLKTPKNKLLPGITRQAILELNSCQEKDCPFSEVFKNAREMFVSQSTSGITPVSSLKYQGQAREFSTKLSEELKEQFYQFIAREAVPLLEHVN